MKKKEPAIRKRQEVLNAVEGPELVSEIIKACQEVKGRRIAVLEVKELSSLCDYFIIASGRSDRQVQGMCNKILSAMADRGVKPDSVEGLDKAHWVLIDFGDVVVHLFYEPLREYYDLESLWGKAKRLDPPDDYQDAFA